MPNPSPTKLKSVLRCEMRKKLRTTSTPAPDVCTRGVEWLHARPAARVVAIFSPLPGEPDLHPLPRLIAGRRWCFPKITGRHSMSFHEISDPPHGLITGTYGILEPQPGAPEIPVNEIDAFLCPGLAFDLSGGRLGHGRGYYDRALADARTGAVKAGICFASQLVKSTFPATHDVHMDVVISELGTVTTLGQEARTFTG